MLLKAFIRIIAYASLAGIVLLALLALALPLYKYLYMGLASLGLFLILAIIVYFLAERAINNPRSGAFLSVIVINTFMKLSACFAFIFIYVKTQEPTDKLFLIPFFIFYLVFAVAETHFLSSQARKSK